MLINIWNFAKNYFLTGAAIISIMWGIFVKVDSKKDKTTDIENKLKSVISIQSAQQVLSDSMVNKLNVVNDNIIQVMKLQNALRGSYVKYLSSDDALTKEDFLEYMQGLEFDVKSNNSLDGYKIGVRKSNIKPKL